MKSKWLVVLILIICTFSAVACGLSEDKKEQEQAPEKSTEEDLIVIGFSQLGAESDWRSENTKSMQSTFTEEKGYKLLFEDGQQSQTNQITAIRRFIQQDVDYIVLAPVTEDGWDTVLSEAKEAEIPVIIVDRMVNVADDSLYTCFVGSDFELEARKVTEWLNDYCKSKDIAADELHIVNIQGTMGASAQIGRTNGLRKAASNYGWDIIAEESGEFTQTKGREVTNKLLRQYADINVVYCENDNSAFGAIQAIKQSGKRVGSNIKDGEVMVISFDGVNHEALLDVVSNQISCVAECNPLHGPRVEAIIKTLEQGGMPDKKSYVDEKVYSAQDEVSAIMVNDKKYDITILSEDNVIDYYIENQMKTQTEN